MQARSWRRAARRGLIVLGVLAAVPLLAVLGLLELLRTEGGQDAVRRLLVQRLRQELPGLRVGLLRVDPSGRVLAAGISLRDAAGREAVRVASVTLRVDLWPLLWRRVQLPELRVVAPRVLAYRWREGRWNLENTGGLWINEKIPSISGIQPLTRITTVYQPAFFWSASRVTRIARARLKQTCSIYIVSAFVQQFQIGTGIDKRQKIDSSRSIIPLKRTLPEIKF